MTLSSTELGTVAEFLAEAGVELAGPLSATPITGGRSNLTIRLEDGRNRWVLRMPPRTGRTPSAHDVAREYRVTSALVGTDVPVARTVLLCEDDSVLGAPFAVSEFVTGRTIQTSTELDTLDDATLALTIASVVSSLAALHRIDPHDVGLDTFGKPTGYAERQLRTWSRQWELVGWPDLAPLAASVAQALGRSMREQSTTTIVHGDYRIDNTMLDVETGTRVVAVVDWELSTLGDPAADVALMCAYADPAFDLIVGEASAWTSPRIPSGDRLVRLYTDAGGAPLDHWELHLALAHYKIAVIAAGIDHRRRSGSGSGPGFDTAGQAVEPYLEAALEVLVRAR